MENLRQTMLDAIDERIDRTYNEISESSDPFRVERLEEYLKELQEIRERVEFVIEDKLEYVCGLINLEGAIL